MARGDDMEKSYTVGELAALSGVSARTLRFYEETGLLVPQRDLHNGYRRYGAADIDRLQEILLLRRLGVAVRDIAPLAKLHLAFLFGGGSSRAR